MTKPLNEAGGESRRITVRLPQQLLVRLEFEARLSAKTESEIVREALEAALR